MRISILLISSFLFYLVSGCVPAEQQKENVEQLENITSATLALVNGLLIDGTGRDPIYGAMIVIDRDRIVYVGSPTQISIPSNTHVIDVQGAAILPGFVNAHVHGAYDRVTLEEWAFNGVTTVRDLGIIGNNTSLPELIRFRDEISKDPKFARLVAVGPMITVPGGYGRHYVTSPEDARETVESLLDDGVNLIKIGIEDDLQGRKWEMLSYDEITAIVESAHARNVPVSAHISRSEHLALALQTGIDDVAHIRLYFPQRCPRIKSESGVTDYLPIWPLGYSLQIVDGLVEVRNASGELVAREGEEVVLHGGGPPHSWDSEQYRQLHYNTPGDCYGPYWIVME